MASMFLYLLSLLLFPLFSSAQTHRNVTLGTSLSTNDKNPYWASPSGEFSFGFYPIQDVFVLAIWYEKIAVESIIWTANGGNTVESGSKIELTSDGVLSLSTPNGTQIWKAESMDSIGVTSAAMLDTGNFVLSSDESAIKWASFDIPTDTIVPTQILNPLGKLSARLTQNDYSQGRFELILQGDGNLVLYQKARPMGDNYDGYWDTATTNGSQLIFNQSGYIYLSLGSGNTNRISLTPTTQVSPREFYHRATLDFDGVFRQYTYPKNSTGGRWRQSWSVSEYVPLNICTAFGGSALGSGVCGFNSYCKLDDNQRPQCNCPPRYTYIDSNNTFNGCKQDFLPQICGTSDGFELREIPSTDWPTSDYGRFTSVTEDWCRETCLDDCFCAAAIIREGTCWLKKFPLSNGKTDPTDKGKALIKVGKSQLVLNNRNNSCKKDRDNLILPGSILLGSSMLFNLLLISVICLAICGFRHKKQHQMRQDPPSISGMNLRSFTYNELEEATDKFKEQLGKGAFSTVYKGILESNPQSLVAVKRLESVVEGVEKEFRAEMSAIGRTNHKNLVKLFGFCDEGAHRLLVYEFMKNGSLASFLFEGSRPDWYQRIQIAFGIARGIVYLHEECSSQIIHCDIKPQNILLDDSFNVKISDFGLAKLLMSDQSRCTTDIRGTRGYVAPEWFKRMAITAKVDVYSFGIMLLEIICCRKNVERESWDENTEILSDWAYDCYVENKLHLLVENDEQAKNDGKMLERLVMTAIWCIQEDPSLRPSMKKVTQMLEGAIEVCIPPVPDPSTFISSICA
ncbi:hypothetical protein GIB67_000832 [Kingdonia uniflora]|uniref:Receptor-like serine/threonine-protein kinase n=1 Tax=Kingdonia uniflora TaxID=39325 RepID=A0A7J7LEI6_9MAGN|nr:hypothetical protein GIB67_000832 [Kingdonia uniflora]